MADGDPPAIREGSRLPADLINVHPRRVEIEIEMKVDVEIEAASDGKDAVDLAVRITVGVGTAPDQVGARCTGGDKKSG